MPLSFWCEFFDCDPETAAQRMRKSPPFSKHIYLTDTILGYKDRDWAYHVLKDERVLQSSDLMQLVPLLSVEQREQLNLSGKATGILYQSMVRRGRRRVGREILPGCVEDDLRHGLLLLRSSDL